MAQGLGFKVRGGRNNSLWHSIKIDPVRSQHTSPDYSGPYVAGKTHEQMGWVVPQAVLLAILAPATTRRAKLVDRSMLKAFTLLPIHAATVVVVARSSVSCTSFS